MINFAYFAIISHIISSLILIHSLIEILVLVMRFVFAINKETWKSKENGKLKEISKFLKPWDYELYSRHYYLLSSLFRH